MRHKWLHFAERIASRLIFQIDIGADMTNPNLLQARFYDNPDLIISVEFRVIRIKSTLPIAVYAHNENVLARR